MTQVDLSEYEDDLILHIKIPHGLFNDIDNLTTVIRYRYHNIRTSIKHANLYPVNHNLYWLIPVVLTPHHKNVFMMLEEQIRYNVRIEDETNPDKWFILTGSPAHPDTTPKRHAHKLFPMYLPNIVVDDKTPRVYSDKRYRFKIPLIYENNKFVSRKEKVVLMDKYYPGLYDLNKNHVNFIKVEPFFNDPRGL